MNAEQILETAVPNKVAFVPGSSFYANNEGQNCFRLNFSHASPEQIEEGIIRLGSVLAFELQKNVEFTYR